MRFEATILIGLLFGWSLIKIVSSRPPSPIGYFPNRHHPWSTADDGKPNRYENPWDPLLYSDYYSKQSNYANLFNPRQRNPKDDSRSRGELSPQFPVYTNIQDGFVPADLSNLDTVYWWKKRFQNYRNDPTQDIPFHEDYDDGNSINSYFTDGVNKRDYTAAQLVNMLKALAKARRQRQIRVTGKGLRFGISK